MSCLTSIVTGTILASNFFSESVFYLLVLITLSYPVLVILSSSRGPILALLVISFNIGKPRRVDLLTRIQGGGYGG